MTLPFVAATTQKDNDNGAGHTNFVCAVPPGIADGDTLICTLYKANVTPTNEYTNAAFTDQGDFGQISLPTRACIMQTLTHPIVSAAGEPASYTFVCNAAQTTFLGIMAAYRGVTIGAAAQPPRITPVNTGIATPRTNVLAAGSNPLPAQTILYVGGCGSNAGIGTGAGGPAAMGWNNSSFEIDAFDYAYDANGPGFQFILVEAMIGHEVIGAVAAEPAYNADALVQGNPPNNFNKTSQVSQFFILSAPGGAAEAGFGFVASAPAFGD